MVKVIKDFGDDRHNYLVRLSDDTLIRGIGVNELLENIGMIQPLNKEGEYYKSVVAPAGKRGTLIHSYMEDYHKSGTITANKDFLFLKKSEDALYPLHPHIVSEYTLSYPYTGKNGITFYLCGTIDALFKLNGREVGMVDYKTGNPTSKDKAQLNLYRYLVERATPYKVKEMTLLNSKVEKVIPVERMDTETLLERESVFLEERFKENNNESRRDI